MAISKALATLRIHFTRAESISDAEEPLIVHVTRKHVQMSIPRDCKHCAFATCVVETTAYRHVVVGNNYAYFSTDGKAFVRYRVSRKMTAMLQMFDVKDVRHMQHIFPGEYTFKVPSKSSALGSRKYPQPDRDRSVNLITGQDYPRFKHRPVRDLGVAL